MVTESSAVGGEARIMGTLRDRGAGPVGNNHPLAHPSPFPNKKKEDDESPNPCSSLAFKSKFTSPHFQEKCIGHQFQKFLEGT